MKDTATSKPQPLKKTQERKEGRDESAVSAVIDSMTLVNKSYIYEFASEAYCSAHGRGRKDIIGNSVADVWGEENFRKNIKKHLDQCFAGNVVRYENWLEFPGQGSKCYRVSYSPYFNSGGEVTHAVVASLDITDLKKEEEALDKSEPSFRTILKSMHYGVFTFDTSGRFTFVNDVVVKRSGYPREWYVGKSLFDLVRAEERQTVQEHFEASVRGEQLPPYELAYRGAAGDIAWVHISTTAIREGSRTVGVLGLLLDVTKRKKFEQALKESEEKYRTLFEESRDAIFIIDKAGKLTDVNRSFLNLFGYTKEEANELDAAKTYVNPENFGIYLKAIEGKGFVEDFEVKLRKRDGTMMDCLLTGNAQRGQDGTLQRYQGIVRDETARKHAETALQDSERKLKSILHGSPIPQFFIDQHHRVTHWNKALEMLTGIKAEEVVGTRQHWKGFYVMERPCMADLMVDGAAGEIPNWYGGKFSESNVVDGAYKATDFFQSIGEGGKWLRFTAVPVRDSKNNIVGALETLEDYGRSKLAAEDVGKTTDKGKKRAQMTQFFRPMK